MSGYPAAAVFLALAALLVPPSRGRLLRAPRSRYVPSPSALTLAAAGTAVAALAAPAACALAIALAAAVFRSRRRRGLGRRRRDSEGREIAAALEVLVGELRVGSHPVRAFRAAAAESQGDVATGLLAVAARAQLGADVAAGLRAVAQRSAVPVYWSRIAVCWELAAERGLPIAVLMRAAQSDINDRQRFAGRIHAGLAGPRATAAVLSGLPAVGVVLGQLLGARPIGFLIHRGGVLLVIGVALVCAGMIWSDRIIERVAR